MIITNVIVCFGYITNTARYEIFTIVNNHIANAFVYICKLTTGLQQEDDLKDSKSDI